MPKKIIVRILELEALAKTLDKTYAAIRADISRMLKNNQPLEFGPNGKYRLFGEKNKKWYAYDSEQYDIQVTSSTARSNDENENLD